MSNEDRSGRPDGGGDEAFLSRWARLKQASREAELEPKPEPKPEPGPADAALQVEAARPGETNVETEQAEAETTEPGVEPEPLPPLESLTEESDFGPFMRQGVSPEMRRLALRKMFTNPKYAVVDELDPFRADFAAFTPLGDIVTSDMKFHAERLLRKQLEEAAEAAEASGAGAAGESAAAMAEGGADAPGDAAPGSSEPATVASERAGDEPGNGEESNTGMEDEDDRRQA